MNKRGENLKKVIYIVLLFALCFFATLLFGSKQSKQINTYYSVSLNGEQLGIIDSDRELRKWDRISSYAKLFGKKETCRDCGAELKFRETTKGTNDNHKFLYLCDECSPKRWFQMNELHNNNMNVR